MSISRSALLGVLAASVAAAAASAQSARGVWEGASIYRGQATHVTITLDSAASWTGTLAASGIPGGVVPFDSVNQRGDSVALHMPKSVAAAVLRGVLSAGRSRLEGRVFLQGDSGVFRLVRPGAPALSRILVDAELDPRPARKTQGRPPQSDPDSARLVTSDIDLFWRIVERAPADSLAAYLRRDYLDSGSAGVEDFIPGRILSGAALADAVQRNRAKYDAARPVMGRIREAEPAIRAAFRAFKSLYPEAKFPDVYFVVGRFNSGGTSSSNGLLIGAEMMHDVSGLPTLVSHELIHFQQPVNPVPTLLAQSFMEGTADFVAELIAHGNINSEKYKYGYAHEHELWTEFAQQMHGSDTGDWLYRKPSGDRPNDLGYFIGYRIAKTYYEKAADKRTALREIIQESDVDAILRKSGYAP